MGALIRTHFNLARTSLKERRGRTILTCVGIAVGIASIVLILSLMGSIKRIIKDQINTAGGNLIVVRPSDDKDRFDGIIGELANVNHYHNSSLNLSDVEKISAINPKNATDSEFPITAVAPLSINTYTLTAGERVVKSGSVLGTSESFKDLVGLNIKTGTFLREGVVKSAVIGKTLSLHLFGTTEPVGKTLTILGEKFIVVGILAEANLPINYNNVDFDNTVIININHLKNLESNLQIQQIDVRLANEESVERTANKIGEILTEAKNGDTNFSVTYGDYITHPSSALFDVISGMMTIVAGISLIVGGIGVMNIMLVAVAERTHEIGIRKAVGASNLNIFLQFLFESLILCGLGGIIGLAFGYILAFLLSTVTPFGPYIDLVIIGASILVPIIVGTIFGMYPAIKASLRNPIDSLKSN